MTLFEYMSVAISLIVALTFAEGLRGLQNALRPDQRYPIHAAWLFIKLSNPIIIWWSLWGYRDNPEYWNFATYSLALIVPSIVYLQMLSLVSHAPHKVTDWKQHFYNQRRWFFGLNVILGALVVFLWSNLLLDAPAQLFPMVGYSILVALSVAGFVSANSKLHGVVVSVTGAFTLFFYGVLTFEPVSF